MGLISILLRLLELAISLEEHSKFYMRKGVCYSYHLTHWLQFPVVFLTILDMAFSLYLALYMLSTAAYILANVIFHCLFFMAMVSVGIFTIDNNIYKEGRLKIRDVDLPFFLLNIIWNIPILLIKTILIVSYHEDISQVVAPLEYPLLFPALWALISIPLFVRYGTIFTACYCLLSILIAIFASLLSPAYFFRRRPFSCYWVTWIELNKMYIAKDRERKEYEIIEDYNILSFLKDQEIFHNYEINQEFCKICSEKLNVGTTNIIKLDCGHLIHSLCFELWILERDKLCPICRKSIQYHNTSYKPFICNQNKSWVTKLHYYPIVFSLKINKFFSFSDSNFPILLSHRKLIFLIYYISNLIGIICLPFINRFTQNRFIYILTNSLFSVILVQILLHYVTFLENRKFVFYYLDSKHFTTDKNLNTFATNKILVSNRIFQLLYLFIFGLIGLSFYLIIPNMDSLSEIDYMFLIVISHKLFIDCLYQLAILNILCLLLNIIYDAFIVFPVTLIYMAIHRRGISSVWLRI